MRLMGRPTAGSGSRSSSSGSTHESHHVGSVLESSSSLGCVQSKTKTLHFNTNIHSRVLSHWRLHSIVLVVVALNIGGVRSVVHGGHVVSKTGLESDILLTSGSLVNPASKPVFDTT